MPSPINNEGAFEALAELHHDVLGSSHLRLGAHGVNVFTDPYEGKKLAPINLTPTAYRVMYTFDRLNMIYEAGLGFLEFPALYLLKSIFASSSYFFSRGAMPDNGIILGVVKAYLIDYAFIVIPDIHRDWSWIVHPKQDFHNRMKDITRRCLEEVVLESVGDYLDVKKLNRAVKVPTDDQTESKMAKRKTATSSRIECRSSQRKAREEVVNLCKSGDTTESGAESMAELLAVESRPTMATNEVATAKSKKRKTELVEVVNVEKVMEVADVGNVVASVDGGTNPVKLMLKFTGIVELEDARVQSVGVDFQAPITHIAKVAP
ncbi:hypothetical protein ACFX2C_007551 [Malus domestica]